MAEDTTIAQIIVDAVEAVRAEEAPKPRKRTRKPVVKAEQPVVEAEPVVAAQKREKVIILGMAPSFKEAPFDDLSYEVWALNDAYRIADQVKNFRADRWFEIHSKTSKSKGTPEHQGALRKMTIPVYMQDAYPDIPTSVRYPKDEIIGEFERRKYKGARYFTNSVSWMIALAIAEGFKTIALYGVDMANDSEYGWQRPSCEYFVGLAEGLGIEVIIPPTSDLLKCTQLYGFESDNTNRVWIKTQRDEMKKRLAAITQQMVMIEQQREQLLIGRGQVEGAMGAYQEILKRTQ